ncbi:PspC domain-containing protein [Agromyces aerolatus]|uniref:PspC domain-containing protein n=1 Tax=Agromyces sp. LY-1074 TaxID=3074080 RepID=UPI00285B79C5|nr:MULTISPECIES: PspC domain-containing protein [unclassified Agromyces]MDR5701259.1 PspC domain-containing protein [Agromyces sp. LY-1074]MDR5706865.1 PspC domain-containing protein [Agromyces sp. LY-1358]
MTAAAAPSPAPAPAPVPRVLVRRRDCLVAGVAGGLADHLGWPVWVVRLGFVVATLLGGAGVLLYAWLWAFAPWAPGAVASAAGPGVAASGAADRSAAAGPSAESPAAAERIVRRAPVAALLTGAAVLFILIAVALAGGTPAGVQPGDGSFDAAAVGSPGWLAPAMLGIVLAIAAACWVSFIDRPDPLRGRRSELVVRVLLTAALAVLAIVLVLGPAARAWPVLALAFALAALIGIALVYSPTLVALWRDLNGERVRRIRDEQRSEMAAHLHDSVLQTLALIQNRAGASSEAGRLARAQERELRSWLYEGDAPADSDLASDLRDFAAALELDYPVRIDVVAVGMSEERASGELAAATREAMLNAARHTGGEVSVYLEGSPNTVDVYVRDRGPGFDPAAAPADRLGVRESIIGRMRRAGGSATVRRGAGGVGTEVHLRFETEVPRGG